MLIEFEVKIELLIIRFIHFRGRRFKQLVNIILDQQRVSKDTHNSGINDQSDGRAQ